ncbi:MAG: hemin uptake protein HemP [Hyphomicrobium sp.]|nr:MAG: hemin uptake protein HemP [Hyphomicrobium sp.]
MARKRFSSGSIGEQSGSHSQSLAPPRDDPGTISSDVRYRVDELLRGGREAVLLHRGQEYRLRITSTGKLILTK